MHVETFGDLVDWTHALHQRLDKCLSHCASTAEEQHIQWLLSYMADHEEKIARAIAGFRQKADPKALNTWVQDYLSHKPIEPHPACDGSFENLDFDQIRQAVFDLHNQALALYRYLLGRVEIPETRDLIEPLVSLEENEAMRLAQQTGRIRDL